MKDIKSLTDRIIADGRLTRAEHQEFLDAVHKDGRVDGDEKAQISRIFKLIHEKKLEVV